ncbi:MAG: hypothetical protein LBV63_02145 [Candidatus Methanoplasma sp.]|jgi:hypothetical protein|nr:hypothetical protein [Candidatus Methanoplasma sp.]
MKGISGLFVIMAVFLSVALLSAPAFAANDSDGANEYKTYYDQLDVNGKALYDAVSGADADTRLLTVSLPVPLIVEANDAGRAYMKEKVEELFNGALVAVKFGDPMAYWLWGSNAPHENHNVLETAGGLLIVDEIILDVSLYPPYDDGLQEKIDALRKAVDDFESDSKDLRGKVSDINKYLMNLVTYDKDFKDPEKKSLFDHDAYGALADEKHYAVCDGYAKAFQLLADKLEITSIQVYGTGVPDLVNHAWNYVLMDNEKWYAIDVTWNDSGDNAYFLRGGEDFLETHQQGTYILDGVTWKFDYPALNTIKYDVDPPSYDNYVWVMIAAICAIVVVVLVHAARKGNA